MANSVDPDETPRSAASHLGLNCLLRPVCPNTYGKYGTMLWADSAVDKLLISFLFFVENRMTLHAKCLLGDNLHEVSDPIFWEK